jgi:oligoribonuclease
MAESRDHLVWLDMEMTGLDPEVCVPLQLAVVVTTADLVEVEAIEFTIWQPEEHLARMEPYVREMHTTNGLLEAVRRSTTSPLDAERKTLAMIARHVKPGDGVLAGNSIHQDRRFMARYFPVLNGYLHYRMVDVSTLKELAKRWYGPEAILQKSPSQHTALADVRESIRELAHYRKTILKPGKA